FEHGHIEVLAASCAGAIPQRGDSGECGSGAGDVVGERAGRDQRRLAEHAGAEEQSRHRDENSVGGGVVAIRSSESKGSYRGDDECGMTIEYIATVEIDCAMRLDPDVGRVEEFVEASAPVVRFDVERDALLAKIADCEVQTGVVVKRRERARG